MEADAKQKLVELYARMAELTKPECGQCRLPYSCCHEQYCELTIAWARDKWQVDLKRVNGKGKLGQPLPLLGPDGNCTAAPHLRPLCTLHTCEVNSHGCKRKDPEWTQRYFDLREGIVALERMDDLEKAEKNL